MNNENQTFDIISIQKVLGYTFKNPDIAQTAFTHSSFSNENGCESNERLEFLGDALLNFLTAQKLYHEGKEEGEMTAMRIRTVAREPLFEAVKNLSLMKYMLLGSGEKNSRHGKKFISNLYEAILGAIYLDSGGLDEPLAFLKRTLFDSIISAPDYVSAVNEYAQNSGGQARYEFEDLQSNPPAFKCTVCVNNETESARAGSKRDAKKQAACALCKRLNIKF